MRHYDAMCTFCDYYYFCVGNLSSNTTTTNIQQRLEFPVASRLFIRLHLIISGSDCTQSSLYRKSMRYKMKAIGSAGFYDSFDYFRDQT